MAALPPRGWWGIDRWLAVTLIVAAFCCAHGLQWGRVECWNRDQMALRDLRGLKPRSFTKPPFHTYVNHLLVLTPIRLVERTASAIAGEKVEFHRVRLLGSRLLVVAMFLGTIALGYTCARRFYGEFAARFVAVFLGTSATFVAYAHFLSVDTPLLFWMLAVFFFAERIVRVGELRDYVWAGLLTGLCAATKYNGIAVGIAIPVAHLFSENCRSLRSCVVAKPLLVGVAMVAAGFILGNPFAVLDHRRFVADFMYNYIVTPAYSGETGTGYGEFLRRIPEILGWPGAMVVGFGVLASAVLVLRRARGDRHALAGFCIAAAVALLYFAKIGAFARMPTRFALPAVPFLILMAAPVVEALRSRAALVSLLLAPVVVYNVVCSAWVGQRFNSDPRMAAQEWILAHVPSGSTIESSACSPRWSKLRGLQAVEINAAKPDWSKRKARQTVDLRLPVVNNRFELFGRIFQGNRWVEGERHREGVPELELFSAAGLAERNPDFVSVHSLDYAADNPVVQSYYGDLLAERLPYTAVFDGTTPAAPWFVYPRTIDFLDGRMTIVQRR